MTANKGRPSGTSPASALRGALGCEHGPVREALEGPAVELINEALEGRTRKQAAKYLGVTRSTLQKLLADYLEDADGSG